MTEGTEMILHQPPLLVYIEGKTDKDSGHPKTGSQNEIITVALFLQKTRRGTSSRAFGGEVLSTAPGRPRDCLLPTHPLNWAYNHPLVPQTAADFTEGSSMKCWLGVKIEMYAPASHRNHLFSLITENKTLKMLEHQCIMLSLVSTMQEFLTTTTNILLGLNLMVYAI